SCAGHGAVRRGDCIEGRGHIAAGKGGDVGGVQGTEIRCSEIKLRRIEGTWPELSFANSEGVRRDGAPRMRDVLAPLVLLLLLRIIAKLDPSQDLLRGLTCLACIELLRSADQETPSTMANAILHNVGTIHPLPATAQAEAIAGERFIPKDD